MGKSVKIEIMDTTLRDGEQTSGVSFVPHEKLMIARLLLEDLKVDRVEVASARVSDGEFEAVKMICDWAARRNLLHKVEVLGFVDGRTSVDWIQRTGCRVINLLCKGSLKHCTQQLKKTPEEHIEDIGGIMHSFNLTPEWQDRFLDIGMHISYSGVLTFKNAPEVKESAKVVPLDKVLIETDSPYLSPTPYRGKRNESSYVRFVAEELATLRDMPLEEIAKITTQNANKIFNLTED